MTDSQTAATAGTKMGQIAQSVLDALALGGLYSLIAVGVAVIYTVMGMLNFAQGEFIMVPAYVLFVMAGVPFAVAVAAALVIGPVLAMIIERVAFRSVRGADLSAQLVTSLAVAAVLQSIVGVAIDLRPQSVATPSPLSEATKLGDVSVANLEFLIIGVTILALAGLGWLLHRTRIGLEMRAASENFEMARLVGVHANRLVATAFGISGLLAAIAGVLLVLRTGQVSPTMGLTPVLVGFVAVTIGGFDRIAGAVVGGLALGAASSLLGTYLPSDLVPFRDAIVFSLPIALLIVRPRGLLTAEAQKARI